MYREQCGIMHYNLVKKIDLILSALATKKKTASGHKNSFGDGGNIYYLDCGDGIKHNFLDPNTENVYMKYVHFCILSMPQ